MLDVIISKKPGVGLLAQKQLWQVYCEAVWAGRARTLIVEYSSARSASLPPFWLPNDAVKILCHFLTRI